jgi:hypothetical protein
MTTGNATTMQFRNNLIYKLWCGLQKVVLRLNSLAAYNIRLNEILKRRALFGNLPAGRQVKQRCF